MNCLIPCPPGSACFVDQACCRKLDFLYADLSMFIWSRQLHMRELLQKRPRTVAYPTIQWYLDRIWPLFECTKYLDIDKQNAVFIIHLSTVLSYTACTLGLQFTDVTIYLC